MAHPLDSVLMKINRADEHIHEFDPALSAYLAGNPHVPRVDHDAKTGITTLRLEVRNPLPLKMNAILGDVLHNLRSALDHLAWQVALLNVSTPYDRTQFPIFDDGQRYANAASGRYFVLQSVAPVHRALFERLQPYQRGSQAQTHPLWLLHELSNTDKHRLVPVISTVVADNSLKINSMQASGIIDIRAGGRGQAVDGAILAQFRMPGAHVNADTEVSLEIQFGQGNTVAVGEPLFPVLKRILSYIEKDVVHQFLPLFP